MTLPSACAQSSFAWYSSLLLEWIDLLRFWQWAVVAAAAELHPGLHKYRYHNAYGHSYIRPATCGESVTVSLAGFIFQTKCQCSCCYNSVNDIGTPRAFISVSVFECTRDLQAYVCVCMCAKLTREA